RRDVDTGHTIDERVVRLLDQPDVPAFETLDEPQLPQRTLAVEDRLLDAGDKRHQLLPRPRLRQRGVPDVVRDVEALIVDPDRPALVVGHHHQLLPKARKKWQPRLNEIADVVDAEASVLVEERLALEHTHRADMHRVLEAFEVQEARVERGQAIVRSHVAAPSCGRPRRRNQWPMVGAGYGSANGA